MRGRFREDRELRRGLWGTESKALERSKKTAQTDLCESREENHELTTEIRADSVEKPGRKPN